LTFYQTQTINKLKTRALLIARALYASRLAMDPAKALAYRLQDNISQSRDKEVPVTPGVHLSGQSAYFEENRPSTAASERQPFNPEGSTPGPRWNSNRYESPAGESQDGEGRTTSTDDQIAYDPIRQHPDLHLSGRIISVAFDMPYNIGFSPGNVWVSIGLLNAVSKLC
jgi:hypothetical protein